MHVSSINVHLLNIFFLPHDGDAKITPQTRMLAGQPQSYASNANRTRAVASHKINRNFIIMRTYNMSAFGSERIVRS